ncbi:MAG: hypothetical protein K6T68_08345 [Alicyclobacillus shizuokensis]|nr:hypothetical protein [Alicyclobacillus shizuokensis]
MTPRVVIVTPTRDLGLQSLIDFGMVLAELAAASPKRVAFIASGDQAHTYDGDGPYGYDPAAAEFDATIARLVREGSLEGLLDIPKFLVDAAKRDSPWQLAILLASTNGFRCAGSWCRIRYPRITA